MGGRERVLRGQAGKDSEIGVGGRKTKRESDGVWVESDLILCIRFISGIRHGGESKRRVDGRVEKEA